MLTIEDKKLIKNAILKAVENGCSEPEILFDKIINTLERIDNLGAAPSMAGIGLDGKPILR